LHTQPNEVSVNLGSRNLPVLGNSVVSLINTDLSNHALARTASGDTTTTQQYTALRDKIQNQLSAQGPSVVSNAPPITLTNSEASLLAGILNANNAQYVTFSVTVHSDAVFGTDAAGQPTITTPERTETIPKNPSDFAQLYQTQAQIATQQGQSYQGEALQPYLPENNLGGAVEQQKTAAAPGTHAFVPQSGSADPGQNFEPGAICPTA